MIWVLDASAMLALLRNEDGAAVVESALLEEDAQARAHILNIVEVFYDFHRSAGEKAAKEALAQLNAMGVRIVFEMDQTIWQDAARLKSIYRRVSLSDCFGVALARRIGCDFLTADRHELEALEAAGVATFTFIR